jgi:hypothetical protein
LCFVTRRDDLFGTGGFFFPAVATATAVGRGVTAGTA